MTTDSLSSYRFRDFKKSPECTNHREECYSAVFRCMLQSLQVISKKQIMEASKPSLCIIQNVNTQHSSGDRVSENHLPDQRM